MSRRVFVILAYALLLAGAQPPSRAPNSSAQQQKPYVILVSLDGFRNDYAERYNAKNLLALGKRGISATGLLPPYPSLTFPSHYSMVTGLYPAHHGIVDMNFVDPTRHERYVYNNSRVSSDGTWYGGTPLWVLAEQQGMRTACFFWPGSEAAIQGVRPSYYLPFDDKLPNEQRVRQALDWLKLPPPQRPHFITLYFSDVDHAGHDHGPDAPEVAAAVEKVDRVMGQLIDGIKAVNLPVNLIVVSDHGMQARVRDIFYLEDYVDLNGFQMGGAGPQVLLYAPNSQRAEKVYATLHGKSLFYEVYRRDETPAELHYRGNVREGDLVVIAKKPVFLSSQFRVARKVTLQGMHGYDVHQFPEMQGIFYALGPNIRRGKPLSPFENVEVFRLITRILRLTEPANLDAGLGLVKRAYRPR